MRLIFTCCFAFLFSIGSVFSQEGYEDGIEEEVYESVKLNFFEMSFSMIFPSGPFAEKVDKSLFPGVNISYLRQLQIEEPAFIGFEIYNTFMGSLSRTYEQSIDNEFIEVRGTVSSNTIGLNLIGRYYPKVKLGPVEPFMEVHFGPKWLYTYLSESGVFADGESYSSSEFLKGDFALAYGGALGAQIFLDESIYLSLKGSYQLSTSAEYYKRIKDEFNVFPLFPIDGFEIVNSITNNIKVDIGFTYLY